MDFNLIWPPVLIIGVMGLIFGFVLAFASKVFYVKVDETVEKLTACLPGANCGGCGYTGCAAYAEAIAKGEAPLNKCAAGGNDAAKAIGSIMGKDAGEIRPMKAHVLCSGGGHTHLKYNYDGLKSCSSAMRVAGGPLMCPSGCIGLGSCVSVCKFDALHIVDGVAKVDKDKCTACGMCVKECPKKLIELLPADAYTIVPCRSTMKAKDTMAECDFGCIGCKKCERSCEHDAIHVNESLALIDYDKCVHCGKCAEVCPRKLIAIVK